jgi:hypothetical protein
MHTFVKIEIYISRVFKVDLDKREKTTKPGHQNNCKETSQNEL